MGCVCHLKFAAFTATVVTLNFINIVNVKARLTLEQAMKAQTVSESTALLLLLPQR